MELVLAVAPWVAVAVLSAYRATHAPRKKRGPPQTPVRDQFTPEEVEAHWDDLRRKRSDEIREFKATTGKP